MVVILKAFLNLSGWLLLLYSSFYAILHYCSLINRMNHWKTTLLLKDNFFSTLANSSCLPCQKKGSFQIDFWPLHVATKIQSIKQQFHVLKNYRKVLSLEWCEINHQRACVTKSGQLPNVFIHAIIPIKYIHIYTFASV